MKKVPGVKAATPVIQFVSKIDEPIGEPLYLLGIDIFSDQQFRDYQFYDPTEEDLQFLKDPKAIAITEKLAHRHGLKKGDNLPLIFGSKKVDLTITHLLKMEGPAKSLEGNFGLMDIASAQEALEKVGLIDRIDLIVDQSIRWSQGGERAKEGHASRDRNPQARNPKRSDRKDGFCLPPQPDGPQPHLPRRRNVSDLQCHLHLRHPEKEGDRNSPEPWRHPVSDPWPLSCEAGLIGGFGSLIGLGVGIGLAKVMLYLRFQDDHRSLHHGEDRTSCHLPFHFSGWVWDRIGCVHPFFNRPCERGLSHCTQRGPIPRYPGNQSEDPCSRHFSLIGIGLLLLLSLLLPCRNRFSRSPSSAFYPLSSFSSASPFMIPSIVIFLNRLLAPFIHRLFGIEGKLASRYIQDSMARTVITIAALMTALSMLISISIMILSFRKTVDLWVEQSINGDVFIFPGSYSLTGYSALLPLEVSRELPSLPGVKAVDSFRALEVEYQGQPAVIAAVDGQVFLHLKIIRFTQGNLETILQSFASGQSILVTESFSLRHQVNAGDRIRLNTPQGEKKFFVSGVFYDYSSDWGMVLMEKKLFQSLWNDETLHSAGIYLKEGVSLEAFKEIFRERYSKPYQLFVVSHRELRNEILKIFDQTFAITYSLEFIAIFVAILGIINSLNALIIERQRDIGIMRAVGAFRRQVQKTILIEAGNDRVFQSYPWASSAGFSSPFFSSM